MSVYNGPYIPMNNLVLMADPRNTKCYPGSGTAAVNQVDNAGITLSNVSYSAGSFICGGSSVLQTNPVYSLSLSSGYTLIQFMYLNSRAGGTFNYTSGSNQANFSMLGASKMNWQTYVTSGNLASLTDAPLTTWHCWAGTFSGTGSAGGSGTSKLFYNGVLDNSGTVNGTASNSANIQLGIYSAGMNGSLGPTLFYNRVLSDTEVRLVFNAYRGYYGI